MIIDINNKESLTIQAAIQSCASAGGGIVRLHPGEHISGTIRLLSNVHLEIMSGAVLKGIADMSAYEHIQSSVPSRMDLVPWRAFIHADTQENIRVFGGGTIDGHGEHACFQDGKDNSPDRPYGMHFVNCKNVVVENLSLRNSCFWMQRYFSCDGVRVENVTVWNHGNQNNDGLDIDSSQNVTISNCRIDASDDGICIKSEGELPSKNITITNCIIGTHASGLKLGTGSVGGFENIVVSNLVIHSSVSEIMKHPLGCWHGLTALDLSTTDGGALRGVQFSNITIDGLEQPILARLGNRLSGNVARQGYGGEGDAMQGVAQSDASVNISNKLIYEDVTFQGVVARNVGPYPVVIAGNEDASIKRLSLRDVTVQSIRPGTQDDLDKEPYWDATGYPGMGMFHTSLPAHGLVTRYAEDISIENFKCIPAEGEVRPAIKHYDA